MVQVVNKILNPQFHQNVNGTGLKLYFRYLNAIGQRAFSSNEKIVKVLPSKQFLGLPNFIYPK